MKRNELLTTLLLMFIIVGVTVGSAFLLNIPTSKVIEHREMEKVKEYLVYFDGAEGLKDITKEMKPSAASGISKVLEEVSDKGFIVEVSKKGFSQEVKVIVTISSSGEILNINATIGAGDFAADATIGSFVGQNSTLADVVVTTGATVSSNAVINSVKAAFELLIAKDKITEAQKSIEQILEELIPTIHAEFVKGTTLTTTEDVYKAYKSNDGTLTVCHVKKDGNALLAIADADGIKVYAPVEVSADSYTLNDVTSANSDIVAIITEYMESLELEALNAVLPDATGFDDITSELELDESIIAVYAEKTGKGYVVIATGEGFSDLVTVTVGITSEGIVAGFNAAVAPGDFALKQPNIDSFIGQDSTLSGVVLSGGATYSAEGAKEAVASAFVALAQNGKLSAAKKEVEQVFEELLPTVTSGFIKGNNLTVSGNIDQAYASLNKSVVVTYVEKDTEKLLTVTNVNGTTKVYKASVVDENAQTYELVDVTAENADVVTEVTTFAAAHAVSKLAMLTAKVTSLYADAEITETTINTMGTLLSAVSFTSAGTTYYAYYAQTYSFHNELMNIYVILDAEGKIVKVDFSAFFFEDEHFFNKPTFNKDNYVGALEGLDEATLGNATLVTGATLSSNGVKQAINDAFAEFAALGGNN